MRLLWVAAVVASLTLTAVAAGSPGGRDRGRYEETGHHRRPAIRLLGSGFLLVIPQSGAGPKYYYQPRGTRILVPIEPSGGRLERHGRAYDRHRYYEIAAGVTGTGGLIVADEDAGAGGE